MRASNLQVNKQCIIVGTVCVCVAARSFGIQSPYDSSVGKEKKATVHNKTQQHRVVAILVVNISLTFLLLLLLSMSVSSYLQTFWPSSTYPVPPYSVLISGWVQPAS